MTGAAEATGGASSGGGRTARVSGRGFGRWPASRGSACGTGSASAGGRGASPAGRGFGRAPASRGSAGGGRLSAGAVARIAAGRGSG
ncbi:hypothetical protein [Rhodobacter capsulatus]|uniref:hypothetical protein n=1 Tax=Rhodobacter capsulatus TaxID=1061 RepID=UPI0011D096F5|nr:hypothetical protein [Rhodobacter capsulatus]